MRDPRIRLLEKTEVNPDGCWVWTAARKGAKGKEYSAFYLNGRLTSGHQAAYQMFVGPIPEGLHIDHLCRNKLCVNPDHLEPVTVAENNRRQKAVITHCPQGHPYDEANTYISPKGGRGCRKCRCATVQRRKAALRVLAR